MTRTASTAGSAPQRLPREVVSFVRRSTRMNPQQERAWAERERYLIEVPRRGPATSVAADAHLDWPEVFGRTAPLVVEIGCGTGDSLAAMAATAPEVDHVAFEVFRPALASTMLKLDRLGLRNVRLLDADGVEGLRVLFAPNSLAELWTFFPDPWHKARHHKRRLVDADFATLVASRLACDGRWLLATDWEDYAAHCHEVLDRHADLVNPYVDVVGPDGTSGWAPRPEARPLTKYERRGLEAGRTVRELCYRRRR